MTQTKFKATCTFGLPGHRCPHLVKGKEYECQEIVKKYFFTFFNHTEIRVFWCSDGRGTDFSIHDFHAHFNIN